MNHEEATNREALFSPFARSPDAATVPPVERIIPKMQRFKQQFTAREGTGCCRVTDTGAVSTGRAHNRNARPGAHRKRDEARRLAREKNCPVCTTRFTAARSDAKFCSHDCKQKVYRDPHRMNERDNKLEQKRRDLLRALWEAAIREGEVVPAGVLDDVHGGSP